MTSPVDIYEPLGGVYIGPGTNPPKPALFVMSCGEGHLDLRTADKVQHIIIMPSNILVCKQDVCMVTIGTISC